ncbi:MAG: chromate efflux transporter [Terracidiphilus sp.]|jgi:chromate transporter
MGRYPGESSLHGRDELGTIARLFLRLGLTAFGGPAAHIGLMEQEAVQRRRWMSRSEFLDLVGACNLLPGPGSTQVAMALGYRRAGWMGLGVAGTCFILPSTLSTLALAWAYVRYGSLPQAQGLLYGAKPVMVAIIVQAVWNLGRMACRRWPLSLAGLACFAAALAGAPPIAVLLVSGGLALLLVRIRSRPPGAAGLAGLAPAPMTMETGRAAGGAVLGGGAAVGTVGLFPILLIFLKMGVVVFGSGYVLLTFFKADLVDRLHWVTGPQLLDAVTAGQVTPGPVFATATFLGYQLRGWAGAAVATAAIFLPSFLMAGLVGALTVQIRKSKLAAAFLDGVNAAAVALMAFVALALGRATLIDGLTWALCLASVALLVRFRINATCLILAGAALGLLLRGVA